MRIIDSHVHVLNNYAPMEPFGDIGRVDRLLHLMDGAGVEMAIVLPVVAKFSPDNNAECAQWARQHPDRLATMTDIQLHEPNAAELVINAKETYQSIGISYYPNSQDISWVLKEEHKPIWDAFSKTQLVCNLQVTPANHAILVTLAERNPAVNFLCNHLGLPGAFDTDNPNYNSLSPAQRLDNVYIKASAFYAAAKKPWDPKCPQALGYLSELIRLFGAKRILWGSDWPPTGNHLTYKQSLEIIRVFSGLKENQRNFVLGENAANLFGI